MDGMPHTLLDGRASPRSNASSTATIPGSAETWCRGSAYDWLFRSGIQHGPSHASSPQIAHCATGVDGQGGRSPRSAPRHQAPDPPGLKVPLHAGPDIG